MSDKNNEVELDVDRLLQEQKMEKEMTQILINGFSNLVMIRHAAREGLPMVSCQGKAMDAFAELTNYHEIIDKTVIATADLAEKYKIGPEPQPQTYRDAHE